MNKRYFTIITLLAYVLIGCGSSNKTNSDITIYSNSKNDTLGTLSTKEIDLKKSLTKENWKKIKLDLDKFFTTSILTINTTYNIDMSFNNGTVIAYADCKKLTAHYKIDDKKISFSRLTNEPDLDHAICQQSEDADQAVYQFLYNSFEATEIKENEITFKSDDFDAEVVLSR